MRYVICYDISCGRRRAEFFDAVAPLGVHIQRSVFEVDATRDVLDRLLARAAAVIDPGTDSVYAFPICRRDRPLTRYIGQSDAAWRAPGCFVV